MKKFTSVFLAMVLTATVPAGFQTVYAEDTNAEDTQENAYQSETAQAESQQTQQQYTNYEEINYEGPASEQNQSDVAAMTKNFFTQALEMIKHPSTGFASSVADENSKNGLILMGIQALLAGLYLFRKSFQQR